MDERAFNAIMEVVCDNCYWYRTEEDHERLEERCAVCPVERILKEVGGG